MNYIQYFAAVVSLVGVILNIKKSRWGFLFYSISTISWILWAFPQKAWGLVATQLVFLVMNVVGFKAWSKDGTNSKMQNLQSDGKNI